MEINIEEAADRIEWDYLSWPGNCFAVASKFIKHEIVQGKARYGHWLGPVAKQSIFYDYFKYGIVRHGWIELDDGTIVDPTRYVFENVAPYIYVGENDHYDIGGNAFRKLNETPPPEDEEPADSDLEIYLPKPLAAFFRGNVYDPFTGKRIINRKQAFWLANLSLGTLGQSAEQLYKELVQVGMKSFIPLDNYNYIFGEENA